MELLDLTVEESRLIAALAHPDSTVTTITPSTIDHYALWNQLTLCLRVLRYAESTASRLKPLIGKFLLMVRDNPACYLEHEYRNYDHFIRAYVCGKMGMSRTCLYQVRRVAERLPDLTPEQYEELGDTKAMVLSRFTHSGDSTFPQYLAEAQSRTATEFIEYCEDQRLIGPGEARPCTIVIYGTVEVSRYWKEFIAIPEVQAKVGSANPAVILAAMMAECSAEWLANYQQ